MSLRIPKHLRSSEIQCVQTGCPKRPEIEVKSRFSIFACFRHKGRAERVGNVIKSREGIPYSILENPADLRRLQAEAESRGTLRGQLLTLEEKKRIGNWREARSSSPEKVF